MSLCNKCKQEASTFVYSAEDDMVVCRSCKPSTGQRQRIVDATGKVRDRIWLNNKLEMTRTDKSWEADIKRRKLTPNGNVTRS